MKLILANLPETPMSLPPHLLLLLLIDRHADRTTRCDKHHRLVVFGGGAGGEGIELNGTLR